MKVAWMIMVVFCICYPIYGDGVKNSSTEVRSYDSDTEEAFVLDLNKDLDQPELYGNCVINGKPVSNTTCLPDCGDDQDHLALQGHDCADGFMCCPAVDGKK
uniref:WAP domain-containing protein n=1 Tax=Photinus pyralis TaxID=7054 RepID=A0A1Y1N7B6_PHOPY